MRRLSAPLLAVLLALLVAGCGWQLRGMGSMQLPYKTMYIALPETADVRIWLERYIRAGGRTTIVDSAKEAEAVFQQLQDSRVNTVLSVNAQGRVRTHTRCARPAAAPNGAPAWKYTSCPVPGSNVGNGSPGPDSQVQYRSMCAANSALGFHDLLFMAPYPPLPSPKVKCPSHRLHPIIFISFLGFRPRQWQDGLPLKPIWKGLPHVHPAREPRSLHPLRTPGGRGDGGGPGEHRGGGH